MIHFLGKIVVFFLRTVIVKKSFGFQVNFPKRWRYSANKIYISQVATLKSKVVKHRNDVVLILVSSSKQTHMRSH